MLGIELDDKSHSRSDREKRDIFVNEVFEAAGLPLARVKASASYNVADLKKYLEEKIAGQIKGSDGSQVQTDAAGETAETSAAIADPVCPKCGIAMVVRDSKRGKFYGCKNYPRCKETRSI